MILPLNDIENNIEQINIENNAEDTKMDDEAFDNIKQSKYILYGAIIHSGKSAEFGHYYTIARNSQTAMKDYYSNTDITNTKWHLFNDTRVSDSSYNAIQKLSKTYNNDVPYMLFYERINANINNNDSDNDITMTDINKHKQNEYEWKKFIDNDNEMFEKELKKNQTKTSVT